MAEDYLSIQQKESLKRDIATCERALEETKHSEYSKIRALDPRLIWQKLKIARQILGARTPPDYKDNERAKIAKRAKELEVIIKQGMPTYDEMMGKRHSVPDNPSKKYQEAQPAAIKKNIAWEQAKQKYVNEWKNLMRVLEPNDPNAANMERLRKGSPLARRIKGKQGG